MFGHAAINRMVYEVPLLSLLNVCFETVSYSSYSSSMDSLLRFSFATADSKYNDNTLHRTRATGREARAAQGSFSFALVSQLRWFRVCVPTSMDNIDT